MERKIHIKKRFAVVMMALMVLFNPLFVCAASDEDTKTVSIVAVGDDLLHEPVYQGAKGKKGYNFDHVFRHVKKDVSRADLAVINQETILVKSNYTSYPSFGSPYAVAKAINKAGFDVVTHATNHTMDRGTGAISGTLKYWKKFKNISVLGIHGSKKAASKITVVKKNGIRIAMLNYTYGLNGIKVPAGKGYMVDLLSNKSKIRKDIKKAKKQSDFVIVFAHWGTEYKYNPDSSQKSWAKFFADEGVDLVIGAHPHVVEPYKTVQGKRGHKMGVYYSLGNFVSAQSEVPRMLGAMAKVTIVKDKKGTRIKKHSMVPLVTHCSSGSRKYTVYKLSDYSEKLANKHRLHGKGLSKKGLKKLFTQITK